MLATGAGPARAGGAPVIRTAAGSLGPNAPREVSLYAYGLAVSGGTVYVADGLYHVVRAFDTGLRRTWVAAGTGSPFVSGRPGLATRTGVGLPTAVAAVPGGGFVVAGGGYVQRVDRAGRMAVVAGGGGEASLLPDGTRASGLALGHVAGLAAAPDGTVYATDAANDRVLAFPPDGTVEVVAGTGVAGSAGLGGPARALSLDRPAGLALTAAGDLLVADSGNHRVVRVDPLGLSHAFAGLDGRPGHDGDGGPAVLAHLTSPRGLAVTTRGDVLVGDSGRIRRVVPDGTIATAHTDSGAALAAAANGDVYYSSGSAVRVRRADGRVLHAAGEGIALGYSAFGGGRPDRLQTAGPLGVAVGGGAVYWTDESAVAWRLRGGRAAVVTANEPPWMDPGVPDPQKWSLVTSTAGVAVAPNGRTYVTDDFAGKVFRVTARGRVHVAGRGDICFATDPFEDIGDGGPAADAVLCDPAGVAATASTVYVADSANHRIRAIDSRGRIRTVAGDPDDGFGGFGGDGGPAVDAELRYPQDVAVGPDGSLYVADTDNGVIRRIDRRGVITTFAGRPGVVGYGGDGGQARAATLTLPTGVAVARDGTVYVADSGNHAIRRIDRRGVITTVAGNGRPGFAGDGAAARSATLACPNDVAVDDATQRLYVADTCNNRIRVVQL